MAQDVDTTEHVDTVVGKTKEDKHYKDGLDAMSKLGTTKPSIYLGSRNTPLNERLDVVTSTSERMKELIETGKMGKKRVPFLFFL